MEFENRFERRKRLHDERRTRIRRRLKHFSLATVGLATLVILTTCYGVKTAIDQTAYTWSNDDSVSALSMTTSDVVMTNLPSKISEINDKLGISSRQSYLSNAPANTATAVAILDLSDNGRGNVSYNGDMQFTAASTYKIFIAYAMIHDVEAGARNWDSQLAGTTWEACLSKMIINSDNECPEAYLHTVGYSTVNDLVHNDLGVSSQTQFAVGDIRTTANDLANVLGKLYDGELMTDNNKDKLLGLMRQQVYRDGIPAGVGDSATVADKVGFLDSILNDAGIVESDSGDYAMVILTNGESWQYIAELAEYINSEYAS